MNGQTEPSLLLQGLSDLRGLLERPTRLSPWRRKIVQREAQRIGDRCWYYVGWYSAHNDNRSENIAQTTLSKLDRLINLLEAHESKEGRPPKGMPFVEAFVAMPEFAERKARGESPTTIIRSLQDRGVLNEKKKEDFYIKRFDRALERVARRRSIDSPRPYDPFEGIIDLDNPATKLE
jgi:hypothetical protein